MYEKVNPSHPDKVADRIAGAIVDLAYKGQDDPKVAVEVLLGHGECHIINETSCHLKLFDVLETVNRIAGEKIHTDYVEVEQDKHLADNQSQEIHCGDNGIFKGVPITPEEKNLTKFVRASYGIYPTDGKFIITEEDMDVICCQSCAESKSYQDYAEKYFNDFKVKVNPLGDWTGGSDVDCGATNRKLGSDMGDAVTGGGLHGKDLSKADVSVNIVCHLLAETSKKVVRAFCAIGAETVMFVYEGGDSQIVKFSEVVQQARTYIEDIGGFEKLAEWGLIR